MGYGTALKLTEEGDLDFDPTKNTFSTVSDVENLTQAIRIILKTLKGEIKFFPDFGVNIPQLLDKNISDDNIKHAVKTAVGKDPRIKSIDGIQVERDRRTLNISMQVITVSGATLDYRDSMTW